MSEVIQAVELQRLNQELADGICSRRAATMLDFVEACRLFWGRNPTESEIDDFRTHSPRRGLDDLVPRMINSPEFQARAFGAELERPAHDCLVMTELSNGLRLFFSIRDTFVGIPIAVGVFECDVTEVITRLLRPGMNCVDVGANLGYYSVLMAAVVGFAGGRVYSFEPDPLAFYLLSKNARENRLETVIVPHHFACGGGDGAGFLQRDSNAENYGGMYVRETSEDGIAIQIRALDDVIPASVQIDLVKMDIEGYEPVALQGMRRTLDRCRPTLIVEFNVAMLRAQQEDGARQLLEALGRMNYACYDIASIGGNDLQPVQITAIADDFFTNLLCVPKEIRVPELLQR
jgi:FkbM family methyltransferase